MSYIIHMDTSHLNEVGREATKMPISTIGLLQRKIYIRAESHHILWSASQQRYNIKGLTHLRNNIMGKKYKMVLANLNSKFKLANEHYKILLSWQECGPSVHSWDIFTINIQAGSFCPYRLWKNLKHFSEAFAHIDSGRTSLKHFSSSSTSFNSWKVQVRKSWITSPL